MAISKKRIALLRELENILGSKCYNSNIQNWGPNGVFYGEGRSFRYPISFYEDGEIRKGSYYFEHLSNQKIMSGCYRFGANELLVMRALDQIVKHLEKKYDFKV